MTEPRSKIGDRIEKTGFIIRGVMMLSSGSYRYFIQINKSDNSVVINENDIDEYIEDVFNELRQDIETA